MTPAQYRKERTQRGLTQAGLAALLGVPREAIVRREGGTQRISAEAGLALMTLVPPPRGVGSGRLLGGFEFLRVEVTRAQSTEVYLKVPKGWRPKSRDYKLLGKAAKETTDRWDWDEYGWEHNVEMQSCAAVEEKEAKQFRIYEVKPEASSLPSPNVKMWDTGAKKSP